VKLRYSLTEQSCIVDAAVQACVAQVLTKVVIHSEMRALRRAKLTFHVSGSSLISVALTRVRTGVRLNSQPRELMKPSLTRAVGS